MSETVEVYQDCKGELVNSVLFSLKSLDEDILSRVKTSLEITLHDYDISKSERQLVVYQEQLNDQILRRFLIAKQVEGCTPRTLEAYRTALRRILWMIGKNIPEITVNDIRYYLALRETRDKVCKRTLDNELRYLKTLFTFCQKEDIVRKNPAMAISAIKSKKEVKKAFSELEVEKIRASCLSTRESALVEILISTACRISEVAKIKIADINGDKIIVHGKGQKDRPVYLTAKAQLAVEKYLADRKDDNPWLFCGGFNATQDRRRIRGTQQEMREWYKDPSRISPNPPKNGDSLRNTVHKIGERAGVENCHPHRFRRTCATQAMRRGMPIEQVSKMLGHEEISTTQIYLDLTEEDLAAAHKKFVV